MSPALRCKRVLLVGLACLAFAAHWRVLQNDFVNYDDPDYVTGNAMIQKGLTQEGVAWAFGRLHGERTYWHPLTWLSHMVDVELFGLNPAGHHAVSLLWHAVNVLLLFLVLERMTGARWRSAALAAIWAVHPLQVDTVAWVTERKNLLSAFFWLLTLLAYARYAAKPTVGRYAGVFAGMVLGLMCKPVLVTLPCVLLLLDVWPLRRVRWWPGRPPEAGVPAPFLPVSWPRALGEKLPLLLLSGVMAVLTHRIHDALGMKEEIYGLLWHHKLANAAVAYLRYIEHTLWPANLTVLYLHPGTWPAWQVGLATAILLGTSILGLVLAWRRPVLLVGWLWFLGVLVPTIGLRQAGLQSLADRFAYLPMIGLLLMMVWTIGEWVQGSGHRRTAAAVAAGVLLLGLTGMTWKQTATWRDSLSLWQRALSLDPRNYVAHANLGLEHLRRQEFATARHHFTEATRLRPTFVEPRLNLALLAMREGKPDEAWGQAKTAVRLWTGAPAMVRATAQHWLREQDFAMAALAYGAYLEVAPADLPARLELSALLDATFRHAEAVQQYREILSRQPDLPEVLNDLAWLLATSPDDSVRNGVEAVRLAERACALTGGRPAQFLGTLAAAFAEAGRMEEAARVAQHAVAQAGMEGQTNVVLANQQLLELYRSGQPHRTRPPKP